MRPRHHCPFGGNLDTARLIEEVLDAQQYPANVDKGGISPAQPRPSTEAQETVLAVMRQSLRRPGVSAAD